MGNGKIKITPLILVLGLILLALATESVYMSDFEYRFRTRRFNKILQKKERIMRDCLEGMKPILARGETHGSVSENSLFSLAEKNRITILEYIGGKLIYWSDTEFDVPRILNDTIYSKPLVFLENGWFIPEYVKAGNEIIVGLMRIISDYGFENDIINNGFVSDFKLPEGTGFSMGKEASDFRISDSDGSYLFSLKFPETREKSNFILLPLMLWGVAFIAILFTTLYLVNHLMSGGKKRAAIITGFSILSGFYFVILFGRRPAVLFQTELFSNYRYTMNGFVPSLGHLLILGILLSVISLILFKHITRKEGSSATGRWKEFLKLSALSLPGSLLFAVYSYVFSHLVYNSNINFETFKVLDLNIFSLAGFITLMLLFSVPFLYLLKLYKTVRLPDVTILLLSTGTSMIIFVPIFIKDLPVLGSVSIIYLILVILIWFFAKHETGIFSKCVIFSLVLALFSLFNIAYFSDKKTEDKIKIQLVSYSTENDPTAEHLLLDMWPQISADTSLRRLMSVPLFGKDDFEEISRYLHSVYFNGFWRDFNINIVPCSRKDSLQIREPSEFYEDCFTFFEKRIVSNGHQLTGTGFYFIDSRQGRASYLGRIFYNLPDSSTNCLFLDLYSDVNEFQPGYSELLLDRKYHIYSRLKDYSLAKYVNGGIVLSTGKFAYSKTDDGYIQNVSDYRIFSSGKYDHVLYRNGNVTVVISRPVVSGQDLIISFAYLFAFIFIFTNIILLVTRRPLINPAGGLNFRQKMQLSFIGILLLSFSLIGIVTASISLRQYQTKHYETIKEKLNSIDLELGNSLEKSATSGWRIMDSGTMEEILIRLSNIFYTDINLFDLQGYLIATSRPEVFYRNLTSVRMNNTALINLDNLGKSEYFQKERIGDLEYISAYIPFFDPDNNLLAYLNLPYFRMQSTIAREVSNMIVTIINFTLLIIVISMSIAVFISGRLTSPLAVLSSRLASVELGKKSEHLSYKGNDEVGELVKQYNRMVDELDESARKLTESEREYAWREMAKQIAHEIKNPLTPMKLNVQQLFKSWTDGIPGFEKKLERFTKNQIEYIDNLSSIATAFSSFAKIPVAKPVPVDLLKQIKTTLELFKNTGKITFRIGWSYPSKIMILADKEQINSIFSNLIKNGIQAIPQGQEGIIKVSLESVSEKVVITVSDNGTGIPEGLKKKMFTPNFTTKSSGTGLGLSIVKRYVENAAGRIWFESETEKGSIFYLEFPVYKMEENPG